MKKILVFAILAITVLYCTSCIGCGCTPPKLFIFIIDSAGINVNARYKGLQLRYDLEGQKRVVSDITTMGGSIAARYNDTSAFAFASEKILELVQQNNIKKIEIVYNDSVMANVALKVSRQAFTNDYIINEATLNGKPIRFEIPGEEFTYIFRLWQ